MQRTGSPPSPRFRGSHEDWDRGCLEGEGWSDPAV